MAVAKDQYRPGVLLGRYPQKKTTHNSAFEKSALRSYAKIKRLFNRHHYQQNYIASRVNYFDQCLKNASESELTRQIELLREKLQLAGLQEPLIYEAFAIIREVAGRTMDKRHFDSQLLGGWVMINGMIAQMQTGEGKTLASALPACTAAMARIPVHVITANDYLARRDAEQLQPLYQRLGLVAGSVLEGMEARQRSKIYAGDIVHVTHKQIVFDYLRDKIEMAEDCTALSFQFKQIQGERQQASKLFLRGLCFAIIDEVDSILIDEAVTPVIISRNSAAAESDGVYIAALQLASALNIDEHFKINIVEHTVSLTEAGEQFLHKLTQSMSDFWQGKRRRNTWVTQALTALYLFIINKDYLVRDGKIQIIDRQTGRIMADHSWEQGLHQLIEVKEGCMMTRQQESLARISYQRFFCRYLKLAGTSGTVIEAAEELSVVYGLQVIEIPTHKPCQRIMLPERLYLTADAKWAALMKRIKQLNQRGRPLLIGTCSVTASEEISAQLTQHQLNHKVLNARQDWQEAQIIAQAGQYGNITVATNMAGRGTDIALGVGVKELGGLHVIATARNEARRIDRQLYGRCARQGDPGSAEAFISLQDESIIRVYPEYLLKILSLFSGDEQRMPEMLSKIILRWPQKKHEIQQVKLREQIRNQDRQLDKILAFSGKIE